jgi:hypothetical protein
VKDKAEKAIDSFYEDYNRMKEKNIRENKWVGRGSERTQDAEVVEDVEDLEDLQDLQDLQDLKVPDHWKGLGDLGDLDDLDDAEGCLRRVVGSRHRDESSVPY